jgi:mRNA interferase MazF
MTRREIWWADFERPILVFEDDEFTKNTIPTVVVLPFSTNLLLAAAPGNVFFKKETTGLSKDSVVVTSQIYSIDRERPIERISKTDKRLFGEVEEGLRIVLGIPARG